MSRTEKQGAGAVLKFSDHKRKRDDDLENETYALFTLPLTEFTGARNALAARLKKDGRGDEAARVRALPKPSISAWAVNQLYWNHREEIDQLTASGERFYKAQKSGKLADMHEALDARREVLTKLTHLASSLLSDAGHSIAPDTIHRITTTLEGLSAYALRSDGPRAGRLTQDVDPPGFESLAGFVPAVTRLEARGIPAAGTTPQKSNARRKVSVEDERRRVEETRKAKLAAARLSLQEAKQSLTEARSRLQGLEAAQKRAGVEAKKAEKHRRDVEASLEKATAASEVAVQRARKITVARDAAAGAVEDAQLSVEAATRELKSLMQGSSGEA
jgi:hypothetical protein